MHNPKLVELMEAKAAYERNEQGSPSRYLAAMLETTPKLVGQLLAAEKDREGMLATISDLRARLAGAEGERDRARNAMGGIVTAYAAVKACPDCTARLLCDEHHRRCVAAQEAVWETPALCQTDSPICCGGGKPPALAAGAGERGEGGVGELKDGNRV